MISGWESVLRWEVSDIADAPAGQAGVRLGDHTTATLLRMVQQMDGPSTDPTAAQPTARPFAPAQEQQHGDIFF